RWSVRPGERIGFMVSSAENAPFVLRFVRHLCADPNPRGPGYEEVAMPTPYDGTRSGRFQPAWLGSFGRASGLLANPARGLAITATVWPTTPRKGVQGIVAVQGDGWCVTLAIGPEGGAVLEAAAGGHAARAAVAAPMQERRWYDLAAVIDPDGRMRVVQRPRRPLGVIAEAGEAEAVFLELPVGGLCDVTLAALPPDGSGAPARAHFNGKLERPTLWEGTTATDALLACRSGAGARPGTAGLLAAWDFSVGIPTGIAADLGPRAAHARLVNLPTRAMTGAAWDGRVHDWTRAAKQYGAIHFHDDDQGDLGWQETAALDIPADWPSGLYSAHIRNEAGEDYIPFFVRPASPRSDVVFLAPTYTYQVYGCYVRPGRGAEIAARVAAWGALPQTPDMNPQFGLSTYNHHADGSGVSVASMARPMLDTRPRQMSLMDPAAEGSGSGRIVADSYIMQFLAREGAAPDVLTDHDLHAEGVAAIAPYRVLVTGQHPEYYSEKMLDALEGFLADGGRLIYLGGNGFYWRAEPSAAAPHAIEVRRAESGIRVWATEPGESYHAFGGGYGGLWRRIGRPAHRLVGNGFSAQGRHLGFPYRFTAAIRDPRAHFMTEGIEASPGAVFGDRGLMGGGGAGFEIDSADVRLGTPPHALVVAKGVVIHPDYGPVNEDMLVIRHPRPQQDWSCADRVFFETAAGGAVFSVGSMTFAGSLPVDDFGSVLARLTANVLRRFCDPAPF
ncbi:MAG: N,N-dimethylformamidase beta subunit family domain-containing protein, partial [Acetobacteraceae bacterium]